MNVDFDKKIIFIGGIHGAGKTTLFRKISEDILGLKGIIVLVDEESQILKRLVDRDAKYYPIELIR